MASRPWRDGQDVLRVRHAAPAGRVRGHAQRVAARAGRRGTPAEPGRPRFPARADGDRRDQLEPDRGSTKSRWTSTRLAWPYRVGPRCTSSPAVRSRRGATACGRGIRYGPAPGLTCSMSSYAHAAPELAQAGPPRAYAGPVSPVWQDPGPRDPGPRDPGPTWRSADHGSGAEPARCPGAGGWSPAPRWRNPDVGRPRRARVRGANAPRRAHGIQGARTIHVRRRPLVDHQPGPERAHPQRCQGNG